MKALFVFAASLFLIDGLAQIGWAREWTDATGRYTLEAERVASNDRLVVLQRADHELGAVPLDQLSDRDREFVKSQRAAELTRQPIDAPQTWTLREGLQITGRIVSYSKRAITVQRRRGRIYVNDRVLENLPEFYQQLVPRIVAHFEKLQGSDRRALEAWLIRQPGAQGTFQLEGVVLETENGDEYLIPFFLFSAADEQLLKPGWRDWLALRADNTNAREDSDFLLQSWMAAHQRDAQVQREMAMMSLKLQAVQAGLTSLWEVTLHPPLNQGGWSQWVVVPGRNSRDATNNALLQFPGYIVGPIRRVSGR